MMVALIKKNCYFDALNVLATENKSHIRNKLQKYNKIC